MNKNRDKNNKLERVFEGNNGAQARVRNAMDLVGWTRVIDGSMLDYGVPQCERCGHEGMAMEGYPFYVTYRTEYGSPENDLCLDCSIQLVGDLIGPDEAEILLNDVYMEIVNAELRNEKRLTMLQEGEGHAWLKDAIMRAMCIIPGRGTMSRWGREIPISEDTFVVFQKLRAPHETIERLESGDLLYTASLGDGRVKVILQDPNGISYGIALSELEFDNDRQVVISTLRRSLRTAQAKTDVVLRTGTPRMRAVLKSKDEHGMCHVLKLQDGFKGSFSQSQEYHMHESDWNRMCASPPSERGLYFKAYARPVGGAEDSE